MNYKIPLIFALAGTLALASGVALATKNFNSSKSNTSGSVLIYPDNEEDCEASGGNWLVSGRKAFCYVELKVNGDGSQSRSCKAAGGKVVTENQSGDGGKVKLRTPPKPVTRTPLPEKKEYCEPTDPELSKRLKVHEAESSKARAK